MFVYWNHHKLVHMVKGKSSHVCTTLRCLHPLLLIALISVAYPQLHSPYFYSSTESIHQTHFYQLIDHSDRHTAHKMTIDPTTKSFTVALQPPPGPNLTLPTPSNPSPPTNPPTFNDAMAIRLKVFVEEQHVSASAEIDGDDPRSWQWVIYDTATTTTVKTPVAVIRLVPPPHAPHELLTNPNAGADASLSKYDTVHEPYIKLTRVAVLREYRGLGLGRRLVDEALGWARGHVEEIEEACRQVVKRELRWKGLVLVHAQVQGEKMYERFGFVTDEKMGRWDEEGIEHVGMWKRIDLEPRS